MEAELKHGAHLQLLRDELNEVFVALSLFGVTVHCKDYELEQIFQEYVGWKAKFMNYLLEREQYKTLSETREAIDGLREELIKMKEKEGSH